MNRFEKFIPIILKHEGGYVNDPNDKGGETKYGISKRAYPNLDIKNLTVDDAKKIYLKNYYNKLSCDLFADELLALHLFDMGVNTGVSRAAKRLQIIIGVHPDGIIGKQTIQEANNQSGLSEKYINSRIDYYTQIGVGSNKKFLNGWLTRVKTTKL